MKRKLRFGNPETGPLPFMPTIPVAVAGLVMYGKRSSLCPKVIQKKEIVLSLQGWGPARNIVAFTGGDLTCCPEYYVECTRLIKAETELWVLIETNGYGLTPQNLDALKEAGGDSFWLGINAYDGNQP